MNKTILVSLVLAVLVATSYADIYCHSFRGSNNKLMDNNDNAQNQNRLFDSQNNARGGYQWGDAMTYYSGSLMQIEWTAQHGCGQDHPNTECNVVMQYMCGRWIRDGTETGTPNTIGAQGTAVTLKATATTTVTAAQFQYDTDNTAFSGTRGQHEPLGWYNACLRRSRNRGLFNADQNVNNNAGATASRQNAGGNDRHGFECPEERDYYPYWTATPWKDIAVLTSNPGRCGYYRKNSQNGAKKGMCIVAGTSKPNQDWDNTDNIYNLWNNVAYPWDKDSCQAIGNTWVEVRPWGIGKPECFAPSLSRDNHLGNVYLNENTMTNAYKWIIPSVDNDPNQKFATCVFRIRYNISTEDYLGFREVDSNKGMIDSRFNGKKNSPVTGNPTISFGVDSSNKLRNLTLNVNTNQYGRTFSDRSHSFRITGRPSNLAPGARIYNLGVRGRRGNIVQCYPGVEYDFTPNHLEVTQSDYIHFQWTGSDNNGAGNAGSGLDKTDRSNLIPLKPTKGKNARSNYPDKLENVKIFDTAFAYRLAHLDQPAICTDTQATTGAACCKSDAQQNGNNNQQDPQNCKYLNQASRRFDSKPVRPKATGTFYFMSTRNNNFTNRSQKMTIKVSLLLSPVALTGVALGSAGFLGAAVIGGGVWYAQSHSTSTAANVFGSIKI